jgi:hypothetical protein
MNQIKDPNAIIWELSAKFAAAHTAQRQAGSSLTIAVENWFRMPFQLSPQQKWMS